MQEKNFLDELLEEAEFKEQEQYLAFLDLVIIEISDLESQIQSTFNQAKREVDIINDWALRKNLKVTERIDFLKLKLESGIRSLGQKTIDLPHGILKIRKKPDKVEVIDLEAFLSKATEEMVSVVPEQIKPNLNGIKAVIKRTGKAPDGVNVIQGDDEFSLKSKTNGVTNDTES